MSFQPLPRHTLGLGDLLRGHARGETVVQPAKTHRAKAPTEADTNSALRIEVRQARLCSRHGPPLLQQRKRIGRAVGLSQNVSDTGNTSGAPVILSNRIMTHSLWTRNPLRGLLLPMDIRKQVGRNVRRYRLERDWSQEELAFESGLHQTYLSGVENGTRNPTITVLKKLADALGVPPAALWE